MPDSHKLQADPRDPDQIIRDLRDRIEELEPSLADWKGMAMKYRAALEKIATPGPCCCGDPNCDANSMDSNEMLDVAREALKPE